MSTTDKTQQFAYDDLYDEDDDYQVTPPNKSKRGKRLTNSLVLLIVIGAAFWGGMYTQKQHGTSSSGGSARANFASFASGRNGRASAGATNSAKSSRTGATDNTAGTGANNADDFGGFGGGATAGQVTLVDGSNIYVTEASGNVVKISTDASSTFTKTDTGSIADIKPGETVTVRGSTGNDGTVAATSVSIANSSAGSTPSAG